TNLVSELDPAVLRPGRFDRKIEMSLPGAEDRVAILKRHLEGRPIAEGVNVEKVARGLPGFSGAEIENLVNEAAIFAARRSSEYLDTEDFAKARNKIIMGLERRSFILEEDEK